MNRKWCIILACLFVIPVMTVSCSKKMVKDEISSGAYEDNPLARPSTPTRQPSYQEDTGTRQSETTGSISEEYSGSRMNSAQMASRERFMNEDIYFAYDESTITPQAQEILRNKAAWLRENTRTSVIIEGHCDERGTTEYNLALGDRRAESVKAFLINLGIPGSRMTTISYGEEKPVDPGHSESAWAKNRRAHFIIE